jgi:hypothetical protein
MASPSNTLTRVVLGGGTVAAATCLAVGVLLRLAGGDPVAGDPLRVADIVAATVEFRSWGWATLGVLILLATPVIGLATTYLELRRPEPRLAWLSVAVLAVLLLAVLIALI